MPSWDRTRFRIGECIGPRNERSLTKLVDGTLSRFPEIGGLKQAARDKLVQGIVEAIQFNHMGLAPRRSECSGAGLSRRIFVVDVEFVLRRAGLRAGNGRDGLLHGLIFAFARRFEFDITQDLIRLGRKPHKSRREDDRHYTTFRPPKNEMVNLSQADLLDSRKQRVAYWTSRGRAPPICDLIIGDNKRH